MYKKRLIATIVSIFALGVIFGVLVEEYGTFSFRAVFLVALAISVLYLLYNKHFGAEFNNKKILAVAVAVAAFSFGALRVSWASDSGLLMAQFDGKYDNAEFEVSEVKSEYVEAYIIHSEIGVPKGESVRLYLDSVEGLIKGDQFTSNVRYNYKDKLSYKADEIYLTASAKVENLENGKGFLYSIRKSITDTSDELFSGFEFAPSISKAVTVGDRSSLDSYVYSLFKVSGLAHLLAISGLHVSLFAFGVHTFLSTFLYGRVAKSIASISISLMYAMLVGFTVSVVRAVIMFSIVMILEMFLRRADSITSLFMSLAIILMLNPYAICSTGLQLSYLCCLGILLIQPLNFEIMLFCEDYAEEIDNIFGRLLKILPIIATPLLISIASSVFSFPILCTNFDTVSYISPITNVLLVPLFSYALIGTMVEYIIAPIYMPLAKIIAYPSGFFFDSIAKISRFIYDSDMGSVSTHTYVVIIPIVFSIVMIFALLFLDRYKIKVFSTSAVLFLISLYVCSYASASVRAEKNFVEYYDDASTAYLYYQSDVTNAYLDVGGYYAVDDPIFENGYTWLDSYFIIGYDNYSLKRFDDISGGINVKNVYLVQPQNNDENDIYLQIKELAKKRNCDIIDYELSYSCEFDENVSFSIFCDENNSAVIGFGFGDNIYKFVQGDYTHPIYSNTVVYMNDFSGNFLDTFADEIFANENYVSKNENSYYYVNSFKEKLVIDFDDNES